MSWGPTLYAQLPDQASVLALAQALAIDVLPDGSLSTGNHNFALVAISPPWVTPPAYDADGNVVTPGVADTGIWFMGRLNDEWPGVAAATATLQGANVLRTLTDPPVVWAS